LSSGGGPRLSFAGMRRDDRIPGFNPGALETPLAPPVWEQFAPQEPPPTGLAGMFGGKARYEQLLAAAQHRYGQAVEGHRRAEADRQRRLTAAHAEYTRWASQARAEIATHNAAVSALESAFRVGDPDAVEDYFGQLLFHSSYPVGFPDQRRVAYRPEPKELWVEAELPDRGVVPEERGFKYVRTRKMIDTLPRAEREIKQVYASVVAQTALRTLRECFEADGRDLIDVVGFNGHVTPP